MSKVETESKRVTSSINLYERTFDENGHDTHLNESKNPVAIFLKYSDGTYDVEVINSSEFRITWYGEDSRVLLDRS